MRRQFATLVKNGLQKHGGLQFKSELTCVPLKQYGNTYVFKSARKVKIAGISGSVLLRTGGQLQDDCHSGFGKQCYAIRNIYGK